jgi:PAS domain S-box-containing protein
MRLLVVDDHEIFRRGVVALLLEQPDFAVCGQAVDGQDAIDKARDLKPDVIVMDVSMPRLNGLEATRRIRNLLPACGVLILSQHENPEMARQALKAGARGYVVKSAVSKDLISALTKITGGEYFFDPAILQQNSSTHIDVQEILQRSAAFEQALRQSEHLYRSTFELAAVGVAHVSPQGKWLRANKKLCEIVGYSEHELLSLTFQDITHPDDLAADLAQTEKVRKGILDTYCIEKRYIRKDRSHVWITLTVSGAHDASGKLEHFIAVVEDISARKSAEYALRESEDRLQLAQRVGNVGTFEWNIKTGVNRWTPELERMYGLARGGFAGTQSAWEKLVHPEDRQSTVHAIQRALKEKDGAFEAQWRVIWEDGSVHWLLGRAWVVRDETGTPERFIGVNVDITERKRVEEALEESQKQLVLALESSKTAIFDWDVIERRGAWNAQMAAIYAFQPKSEYITAEEWVGLFHSDDKERLRREAEGFWQEGEEFSFEFRTAPRNGHFKWVTSRGRIVRDTDGKAIRMVGIHTDISDRKHAEYSLEQRQAELNEAQRLAKIGSWHWNPVTDTVIWSDELYRIAGRDPKLHAVRYEDHQTLYTPESWERLQTVVNQALKDGTPYSTELEMIRADGDRRWVIAKGEAQRDSQEAVVALRGTVQDITDRKRMEEELRNAEQRTRFSLENANIGTWEWNVQTGHVRWSSNMESVHGQAAGSFGNSFDSFFEGVFIEDRERVMEEIKTALSGSGTYKAEYRQYRSDGTLGWMEVHGRVEFDGNRQPVRMFGICANITERKHTQELLAQEARALSRLNACSSRLWQMQTLEDGLKEMIAATVELLRADKGNVQILHPERGVLTIEAQHGFEKDFLEFFREVSADDDTACGRALRTGERIVIEDVEQDAPFAPFREVARAAGYRAVVSTPLIGNNGSPLGMLSTHFRLPHRPTDQELRRLDLYARQAADFIDRCRSDERLRESNRAAGLFAAIVSSSDDAIVSKNLDGIIQTWNTGAERIFGYTAQQAIGQPITLIIPPDRRSEEDDILARIRRGERIDHFQTVRIRMDGTLIDVSVTISPVYDSSGLVIGASKVARDVTAQKEAAERVRRADDTVRLMKVQDEERRRIARDFHDSAGQTLTVLGLNLAELVQKAEGVAPDLAKAGKQIEEVVQQLHREIRTTSYLLHPPLLDEAGLWSALSWYVQGLAERSCMEIDLTISDALGRLPADMELAIFRMVQECLTNIHRHAQSKTARIRIARENGSVCVEVRDEGKGISPERLAEIESRGAGVGIAGMRERLRQFGGELNIEATSAGTRVVAVIPETKEVGSADSESKPSLISVS